jgi:hypothetical protein
MANEVYQRLLAKKAAIIGNRKPIKGNRKLLDSQIEEIRRRFAAGELQKDLAKRFAISDGYLSKILQGKQRGANQEDGRLNHDQ